MNHTDVIQPGAVISMNKWETYHAAAWERSTQWRSGGKELVSGAVGGGLLGVVLWATGAHHAAYEAIIAAVVGFVGTPLLLALLAYLWQLSRAPNRMRDAEITTLRGQVEALSERPAVPEVPPEPPVIHDIRDLQRQGQMLFSRCPTLVNGVAPTGLDGEIGGWEGLVVAKLVYEPFLMQQFMSIPTMTSLSVTEHPTYVRMEHRLKMLSHALHIITERG